MRFWKLHFKQVLASCFSYEDNYQVCTPCSIINGPFPEFSDRIEVIKWMKESRFIFYTFLLYSTKVSVLPEGKKSFFL